MIEPMITIAIFSFVTKEIGTFNRTRMNNVVAAAPNMIDDMDNRLVHLNFF